MSQLVFEAPHYIHGLWLVAAIAGALWWLDRRLRRDTLEWIAPQLRARLIRSTTPAQRHYESSYSHSPPLPWSLR